MYPRALIVQAIFVLILKSSHGWSPPCSPCQCSELEEEGLKTSDCTASVTNFQLTKIPQLHAETETVYLDGQQFDTIPEEAFFKGVRNNLKFIDMKNCQVRDIHVNAFKNLEHLSGLELSHNELTNLDENIFASNNKLKILILQQNKIKVLPEKIFNNLPSLKYLDISGNKLQHVYPNQFKNNINLERLILQTNYLTKFDSNIISNLQNLEVLYLDNNPWKCDCQTKDLLKYIIDHNIEYIFDDDIYPICSQPRQWKGKTWLDIKPQELCSIKPKPKAKVTEGNLFEVSCAIETDTYLPVEWLLNGQPLDITNNKLYSTTFAKTENNFVYILKIHKITSKDSGVYKCWTNTLDGDEIQSDETILNVETGIKPNFPNPRDEQKLVRNGITNYRLKCSVVGDPLPKIQWFLNGNILKPLNGCPLTIDSTNNDLVFETFGNNCNGDYTCRATSPLGVTEKTYKLKTSNQKPVIETESKLYATEESFVDLQCLVVASDGLEVSWLRNGITINSNNKYTITRHDINATHYNFVLRIKEISLHDAGNYKCTANGEDGPKYTVNVTSPVVIDHGNEEEDELALEPGQNKEVKCRIKGVKNAIITWEYPDCNKNTNVRGSTLELKDVKCSGRYKCTVKTSKRTYKKEFNLSVKKPSISIGPPITNSATGNIYEHDTINLLCIVENAVKSQPFWTYNNIHINSFSNMKINKTIIDKKKYYYNLVLNDISLENSGEYKCNIGTQHISQEINVQKYNSIKFLEVPNKITNVAKGTQNYKLKCKASGTDIDVTWKYNPFKSCRYEQYNENKNNEKTAVLVITVVLDSCADDYTCEASNKLENEKYDFKLNVVTLELPIIKPPTENEEVVLKCLIRGAGDIQPKWLVNGNEQHNHKIVREEISPTSYWFNLVIKNVRPEDNGNYKCVVGDVEETTVLNVNPQEKPNIEYVSNIAPIEAGPKNVIIVSKVSGTPIPTATWHVPNGCKHEITRETTGDSQWIYLTIKEVTKDCGGQYTFTAKNSKGEETRTVDVKVLSIDEPPPTDIVTNSTDKTPIENENIILQCFIKTRTYTPLWLRNGQVITNNNKYKIETKYVNQTSYWYNLHIAKLSQQDNGSYKCKVNNYESDVTLNVKPSTKPVLKDIPNIPPIAAGDKDVRIESRVSGTPIPNATWHIPSGCKHDITRETKGDSQWVYLTIHEVTKDCAGKYTFTAKNSKGEVKTTVDVQVLSVDKPPPTGMKTLSNDTTPIENENIILTCFIKTRTYNPQWLRDGQVIRNNNKYKIETIYVNQTSYWYNLNISKLSVQDKGSYKCRVNNMESTIPIIDIKQSSRPFIEYISNPINVEEGKKDFTLSCKVSGIPKPKVSWHVQGKQISKIHSNYLNCRYIFSSEIDNYTEWAYLTIRNVDPSCTAHYTCDAKNAKGGEQNTIHLEVISKNPPKIQPLPDNIYEGGNVTLNCLIKGNLDSKPYWIHNNKPVETSNKYRTIIIPIDKTSYWYNLEIKQVSSDEQGNYKCKVNDLETPVILNIHPSSKPELLPEDFEAGDLNINERIKERTLPCRARGTPPPKITWYYENVPLYQNTKCQRQVKIGSNQVNLILQNVGPSCAGKYKCVIENVKGKTEREVNVNINSVQPTIIQAASVNKTLITGENFSLQCLVPDRRKYSAKWYRKNDLIILEPNGRYSFTIEDINATAYWHNLEISKLVPSDKGEYKCIINGVEGIYTIPELQQPVKPKIEYIPSKDLIVQEGTKDYRLACKVSGIPKPLVTWQFEPNENAPQGTCKQNTPKISEDSELAYLVLEEVTPSCFGKYSCVSRNSAGFAQQEINLSVTSNKPTLQLFVKPNSPDGVIRENSDVTLQCLTTGTDAKVSWYYYRTLIKNGGKFKLSKQQVNPITTWHTLTVKNVKPQDKGTFTCKTSYSQQSYNLEIASTSGTTVEYLVKPNLIVDENANTVLSCKVSNIGDSFVDWTFNGDPIADSSCNSETDLMSESTERDMFSNLTIYNIDASCSGQFKCEVDGLEHTNVLDVTVLDGIELEISQEPNKDIIMEGEKIILKCFVTSGDIDSAKWYYKDIEIQSNDKYTITRLILNETNFWYNLEIPKAQVNQQGEYKCKSGNFENSVNVFINPEFKPIIQTISNPETIVQEGDDVTLVCKSNAWPPAIVNLKQKHHSKLCQIKDTFDPKSQLYYLKISNVHTSCAGQYVCTASNSKGEDTKYINLVVVPTKKPEITLNSTSSDGVIREGDTVIFNCLVTGKNKNKAKWYGNGISNQNAQIKSYEIDPLTTKIELTVTSITLKQSGTYTCGTPELNNFKNVVVTPGTSPNIDNIPDSIVTVSGTKSPTVYCKVSGFPKPNVNWFFNGRPVNLQNNCKYKIHSDDHWYNMTIDNPVSTCIGNYKCVASSTKGKSEKEVIVRSVQPQTPETKVITNDNTNIVKENDKITLNCLVKGDISIPIQWLYNGKPVQFDQNHKIIREPNDQTSFWYNLQINRASFQHNGIYQCKTPFSQSNISLNVQKSRKPTITISSSKVFIPQGKEQLITCTTDGIPIPSVTWQRNNKTVDICSHGCQLKTQEITNDEKGSRRLYLTVIGTESCSGNYKCVAENANGKIEKSADVVVIPPEHPKVYIREPVYPTLNTNVILCCEVESVDIPKISWKNQDKNIDYDRSKYDSKTVNVGNNLYISNLTIRNFQSSDMADYICEAKLHDIYHLKSISLKPKSKFQPYFEHLPNVWNNMEIKNNDLILINKFKSYPPPKWEWNFNNNANSSRNPRYKTAVSYINNDSYWFNVTISNFNENHDVGLYTFVVNNEIGKDEKRADVQIYEGSLQFTISQSAKGDFQKSH